MSSHTTTERSRSFWGDVSPILSDGLPDHLAHYDWHYTVIIDSPRPASPKSIAQFGEEINRSELFPHRRRYTTEPPGWTPIRYRDTTGNQILTILIAAPPGGLRCSVSAFEGARPVFVQAVHRTFIQPQLRVRLATPLQIEALLKRIEPSTVEFTNAFVREHHETWDASYWASSNATEGEQTPGAFQSELRLSTIS